MFAIWMGIPSFLYQFLPNSYVLFFKSFAFHMATFPLFSFVFTTVQYFYKYTIHVFYINKFHACVV